MLVLPGHVRALAAADVPDGARAVEEAGFDTFSVSDRLAWSTPEPLTTLAAAAAVTSRVGLLSGVLLAPMRNNPGLFATAAATVDQLAGPGRLRLGLAPGGRSSDYAGSGVDFSAQGKVFDEWLTDARATWQGTAGTGLGPLPSTPGGPGLLFGGGSAPNVRRVVTDGVGWIAGGTDPQAFAAFAQLPKPSPTTITTAEQLRATVAEYQAAGADEIILTLNDPDPVQVSLVHSALSPATS